MGFNPLSAGDPAAYFALAKSLNTAAGHLEDQASSITSKTQDLQSKGTLVDAFRSQANGQAKALQSTAGTLRNLADQARAQGQKVEAANQAIQQKEHELEQAGIHDVQSLWKWLNTPVGSPIPIPPGGPPRPGFH